MNKKTFFSLTASLVLSLAIVMVLPLLAGAQAAPTITSISPSAVSTGAGDTTLLVNGTNFVSDSVVRLSGADLDTTYVSSTQLSATIDSSDLAASGTRSITIVNPDDATSNSATLTVLTAGLPDTGFAPDNNLELNISALLGALVATLALAFLGAGFSRVFTRSK